MKTKSFIYELLIVSFLIVGLLLPTMTVALLLEWSEDAISLAAVVVGIVVMITEKPVMRWLSRKTRIPPPPFHSDSGRV